MLHPYDIMRLYNNVLQNEVHYHKVEEEDVRRGIREMTDVYKPNKANWTQEVSRAADYNDIGHRCAYLHKYAPLHTAMVQELFGRILHENDDVYCALMSVGEKCLKICSLGGGPGTDAIGVLSAVHQVFGLQKTSVQVIELKSEWEYTFQSIFHELVYGDYGPLSRNLYPDYFKYSYITANLLGTMDNDLNRALASANLISMVKFVSAATCVDTTMMVNKIFNLMKPGALMLFIDNAAGGFSELIYELGQQCNLEPVFGPLNHAYFGNPIFSVERYGYLSYSETKLTVHVWMKPVQNINIISTTLYYNQNLEHVAQHVSTVSSIQDTKSFSNKLSSSQAKNQQTLPLPSTAFKVENNRLGHIPDNKSTISNHGGFADLIPATNYKPPFSSSKSLSTASRTEGDILKGKISPIRITNVINNYGTQKSNTRLATNKELLNSKDVSELKTGFIEVLVEASKDLNTIPDTNMCFKQSISKDNKSGQISELTKSKELIVPILSVGYTDGTQNKLCEKIIPSDQLVEKLIPSDRLIEKLIPSDGLIEKVITSDRLIEKVIPSDRKTIPKPFLTSSNISRIHSSDLLTRDNTNGLQINKSNLNKKGWFHQMTSIIQRILCFCFSR